jgi:hypothetical protein
MSTQPRNEAGGNLPNAAHVAAPGNLPDEVRDGLLAIQHILPVYAAVLRGLHPNDSSVRAHLWLDVSRADFAGLIALHRFITAGSLPPAGVTAGAAVAPCSVAPATVSEGT